MFNNYNPYYRYMNNPNIFSGFKKINWSSILDGTQKTLSIINQAIPVIYQIKPLYENAKTAFKVVNILKEDDKNNRKNNMSNNVNTTNKKVEPNNSPTYFL